jgi:hypothetical protein
MSRVSDGASRCQEDVCDVRRERKFSTPDLNTSLNCPDLGAVVAASGCSPAGHVFESRRSERA